MSSTAFLPPLARLLMSSLFVWDGIVQLRNPGGTAQYFASVHVPAPPVAVWISIPVHLLGGLALLAGFYSRWAAALPLAAARWNGCAPLANRWSVA